MRKHLLLMVSLCALLALGLAGSYLYFSNFSKHTPINRSILQR